MSDQQHSGGKTFQAPRGTRDFYPQEMLRRRWIEDSWRRAAVVHGFDEIDGPRFEHLDLYTVKSGDGIVSELFSFTRAGGETAFALRPEFTPTVARMVAARANSLPRPIKWFSVGPYFRAERPQRGRLREFLQWNVDIFGDDSPRADAEVIACCVDLLRMLGLGPEDVRIKVYDRTAIERWLTGAGVAPEATPEVMTLIDKRDKLGEGDLRAEATRLSLPESVVAELLGAGGALAEMVGRQLTPGDAPEGFAEFARELERAGVAEWCECDPFVVRGLAYYNGLVFEVHEAGGKERAIAGGGRYDGLVELFGGPATPAVGFAMGDVVLSLVLEDKGLMPEPNDLRARTGQGVDAFVISPKEELDGAARSALASLRREGLHVRMSARSTRNIGKLIKEALGVGARACAIIESDSEATLKHLDSGEQRSAPLADLAGALREERGGA